MTTRLTETIIVVNINAMVIRIMNSSVIIIVIRTVSAALLILIVVVIRITIAIVLKTYPIIFIMEVHGLFFLGGCV